jgi:hypothetical protein
MQTCSPFYFFLTTILRVHQILVIASTVLFHFILLARIKGIGRGVGRWWSDTDTLLAAAMRGTAVAASWSSFLLLLFFAPLSLRQKEKTTKLFHITKFKFFSTCRPEDLLFTFQPGIGLESKASFFLLSYLLSDRNIYPHISYNLRVVWLTIMRVWLPMHKLQRSWVRSQHPSAQWNLRGGRWNSAEYCTNVSDVQIQSANRT